MKILVCLKPIADPKFIGYDFASGKLTSYVPALNPYDVFAVKEAMALKGKTSGRITALSIAPPEADDVLKKVFITGVDECYRVWDPAIESAGYLDARQKAHITAGFIRRDEYDIVFCGARSKDWGNCWFGACLAEQLGLPFISRVTSIDVQLDGATVNVNRKMEGRWRESYRLGLPAVIAVEETVNEPKYLAPLKRKVIALDLKEIGLEKPEPALVQLLKIGEVRPRTRTLTATSQLSITDRLKLVTGDLGKKKGQTLEMSGEQAAKKIWEKIQELLTEVS